MNVEFLMFELKLSKEEMGKKLGGVSRQNVDKILNSDNIRTSTIGKFAEALGYQETDLIDPNFKVRYINKDIK